ncbi:MAG: hypothetical protein NTZ01_00140 [Verrucomicrobia bacterium]|nr:hypothetical protein [Verrucomicrobiota bacterium]
MHLPGFKRDPIREELRRISRESSRLGQTTRRLVEEASAVPSGRYRPISSVSPASQVRSTPVLLVEGRRARRNVVIAAVAALILAWVLFLLVANWSA